MAIQFVMGDLSINKKQVILNKLAEDLNSQTDLQVYYIVPDHIKFDMESFVLEEWRRITQQSQATLINFQVASFKRLSWFLNKDRRPSNEISELGLAMIVRQVLDQLADRLVLFRRQVASQAFTESLVALFMELIEGNVGWQDLAMESVSVEDKPLTDLDLEKQRELQLIYQHFLQALEQFQIENFSQHQALLNYISQHSLANHVIVVDHYYYFNSQEMQLLLALAQASDQVYVLLPVSAKELLMRPASMTLGLALHTYYQVRDLGQQLGVNFDADWQIDRPLLAYQPAVTDLAQQFKASQDLRRVSSLLASGSQAQAEVHFFHQYDSIQEEFQAVSNTIHYLVSEEGYRYQDFQIFTRDLERYQSLVDPLMTANGIPYFFDHAKKMTDHVLFLIIQSLQRLDRYHWRLQDILAFIKSPLIKLPVFHPQFKNLPIEDCYQLIYVFENYLIAYQYQGYRFTDATYAWLLDQENQLFIGVSGQTYDFTRAQAFEWIRQFMIDHLFKPTQSKRKTTHQAQQFYHLLDKLGIRTAMIQLRDQAIQVGDLAQSRQDEQVWQVLVKSLEEFQTLYGQQAVDTTCFYEVINAGLSAATYHIIPPTLDQVTITSILSPQVQPCKIAFVIGMDQEALPAKSQPTSLLSNDHRQAINDRLLPHQYLADHEQVGQGFEYFIAYQVMLLATDRLYLSYASQINDKTVQASPWIQQAARLLGKNFVHQDLEFPTSDEKTFNSAISKLGSYALIKAPLIRAFQKDLVGGQFRASLQKAIQEVTLYEKRSALKAGRSLVDLLKATFYFYDLPERIDSDLALALFGKNLSLSVSRIEQFNRDPYSHFLRYGLRLQERDRHELDAALAGDYFHQALDQLVQYLRTGQLSIDQISPDQLSQIVQTILDRLREDPHYQVMESHPRMQAIKSLLQDRLAYFVQLLQAQSRYLRPQFLATEWVFDGRYSSPVKAFAYPLSSGGQLSIRGKIDRIDRLELGQTPYLQVVDYKSGDKKFNLIDAYYGLDLQLLTYLAVAQLNFPKDQVLGAFYQHILPSYLEGEDPIHLDGVAQEQAVMSQRRLSGFVAIPAEDLSAIEHLAEGQDKSLVYPVTYTKKGYHASNPYLDPNQVQTLIAYTHWQFKQAAEAMQQGQIQLAPFYDELHTLSLNKQYRVITGFDGTQSFHRYRHKTMDKKTVWDHIQARLEDQTSQQKDQGGRQE